MFSEITRQQFRRFRRIRRAWYSFLVLVFAFLVSLASEQLANDRPLLLKFDGRFYFPTLRFYGSDTFGGAYRTEADYLALKNDSAFKAKGGWMLFPPSRQARCAVI